MPLSYLDVVRQIFSSYQGKQDVNRGRLDAEVKDPAVIFKIAQKHGLVPPEDRVIKVTGSKGKGTTAHFLDQILRHNLPKARVGLFVSPEEFEHNDRIRVDGTPVSTDVMITLFERSAAVKDYFEYPYPEHGYASPYGVFLLLALEHFKAQQVDWWILETGRGVRHDDSYFFPSRTGVITSIFHEHADKLGDGPTSIALNKLALCDHSKTVWAPAALVRQLRRLAIAVPERLNAAPERPATTHPAWIDANRNLAEYVLESALGRPVEVPAGLESPSHRHFERGGREYFLEALISETSVDREWLAQLKAPRCLALLCLPDDKEFAGIEELLDQNGIAYLHLRLESKKESLRFRKPRRHLAASFPEYSALWPGLEKLMDDRPETCILLWGTHSFVRQLKKDLRGES